MTVLGLVGGAAAQGWEERPRNPMKTRTEKNLRTRFHRNHGVECNLAGELTSSSAEIKTRGSVRASLSALLLYCSSRLQ